MKIMTNIKRNVLLIFMIASLLLVFGCIEKLKPEKEYTISGIKIDSCFDSDGGLNYEEQGIITILLDINGKPLLKSYHEICFGSDSDYVIESYCDGNKVKVIKHKCPAGCDEGACITLEPSYCGDGVCDDNESYLTCPEDCELTSCGNGICEPELGENPDNCWEDCAPPTPPESYCGDGVCDEDENWAYCQEDCSVCGDGFCSKTETPENCLLDCHDECIDTDGGTDYYTRGKVVNRFFLFGKPNIFGETDECDKDYPNRLNELVCNQGYLMVVKYDCPGYCEDGACKGAVCGDGVCDNDETIDNCPEDCEKTGPSPYCGDGVCDENNGEQSINCQEDCSVCGDGFCSKTETPENCWDDCHERCIDWLVRFTCLVNQIC